MYSKLDQLIGKILGPKLSSACSNFALNAKLPFDYWVGRFGGAIGGFSCFKKHAFDCNHHTVLHGNDNYKVMNNPPKLPV